MLRLRQSEYRVQKTLSISLAVNCCYLISTYGVLDSPRKVSDGPVQRICTHRGLLIYIICLHTMYVTCLPSIRHTYRSTCETGWGKYLLIQRWSSCWKFVIQIIQICHVACNFSDIQILFIEGPAASQKLGPSIQYKDLEWKYWTKCSLFEQKRTRNSEWCAHWILTAPLLFDTQYLFLCVFSFFKQSIVRFVTQQKRNVFFFLIFFINCYIALWLDAWYCFVIVLFLSIFPGSALIEC